MTNWKTHNLGDIVTLNYGKSLTANKRVSGSIPVYSSAGITGWHNQALVDSPSIIVGRKGTVGSVYFNDKPFYCIDTAYYILPDETYDLKFMFYMLQTLGLEHLNEDSAVPGLNRERAYAQSILLPDLPTQHRIAEILSALDDKIELNRRMNQTLEQMAQTLYEKYSEVNEFVPLTDLIELNPKLTLRKGTVSQYVEMSNLSETSASIKQSVLREYSGGAKFQNNDTLLARITPCLENGKTGFVDILADNEVGFGSTEYIVMRGKQSISPYFVYCVARDKTFRDHAVKSMTGTSGRQRVQVDMLETYSLPKWNQESMEAFHTSVHAAFQKIKANTAEENTLTQLRDNLLPKLMSGEIDVMQIKPEELHEPVLS